MLDLVTCLGSLHDVALLHGVCQYDPSELFIYLFFNGKKKKKTAALFWLGAELILGLEKYTEETSPISLIALL